MTRAHEAAAVREYAKPRQPTISELETRIHQMLSTAASLQLEAYKLMITLDRMQREARGEQP